MCLNYKRKNLHHFHIKEPYPKMARCHQRVNLARMKKGLLNSRCRRPSLKEMKFRSKLNCLFSRKISFFNQIGSSQFSSSAMNSLTSCRQRGHQNGKKSLKISQMKTCLIKDFKTRGFRIIDKQINRSSLKVKKSKLNYHARNINHIPAFIDESEITKDDYTSTNEMFEKSFKTFKPIPSDSKISLLISLREEKEIKRNHLIEKMSNEYTGLGLNVFNKFNAANMMIHGNKESSYKVISNDTTTSRLRFKSQLFSYFSPPQHRFQHVSAEMKNIQVYNYTVKKHPWMIHGIPWKYFNREQYRLISFLNFPMELPISVIQLTTKGFAYLDNSKTLICCFCGSQVKVLDSIEKIEEEHKKLSGDCPMVNGTQCNNKPVIRPKMNAREIFALLASTQRSTESSRTNTTLNKNSSAQPSDEGASYVVVTNTSDLEDGDRTKQDANSIRTHQPPELLADTVGPSSIVTNLGGDLHQNPDNDNNNFENTEVHESSTIEEDGVSDMADNSNVNSADPSSNNSEQNNDESTAIADDDSSGEKMSYEKLGIITARPKRLEYAVLATRLNSFAEWPQNHHIKPIDLARAGYFFTGYSDCARCFYCGGGLRNWEPNDNVWVEHARWFPKCSYLLQEVGKDFIETVQAFDKERDEIRYDDVMKRLTEATNLTTPFKFKERMVERDPAVLTVIDNGFDKKDVFKLALEIRKSELLSSDKLYTAALEKNLKKRNSPGNLGSDSVSIRKGGNEKRDKATIEILRNENNDLRQQTLCKICMDMEVAVVFLPCGHLVSCTECSCALVACPLCRVGIKGIVPAYMG